MFETNLFKAHIERLKSATINEFTASDIPEWLKAKTFINSRPFSFHNHEYQEEIAKDQSQEIVVRKPSQVGISELSARIAVAYVSVMRHFTIAYTLPTAGFASTFMRTRIDPIIQTSPYLQDLIHTTTDNSEVKRLGDSYLYLRGSQSNNAPISIPVDMLIHDEVNFSNQEVISNYHSRLTHSPYKRKIKLSTPTIPNYGIDVAFNESRRKFNFVICNHCNHDFIPDYHEHVRIPGSPNFDLKSLRKNDLPKIKWQDAHLTCPKCGKEPSLQYDHRQWVMENPDENYVATGYQITPFDAPNIIAVPQLIYAASTYKRYLDFMNFSLGLAAEDTDSTLTEELVQNIIIPKIPADLSGSYVMGIDVGLTSHFIIALLTTQGDLVIVHTETVEVSRLRIRRKELAKQYRVRMTVIDAQPYTETVLSMQKEDPNLYAAYYTNKETLELYQLKEKDEDERGGQQILKQVNINRDKMFDVLMNDVKEKNVYKVTDENDEFFKKHLCDMNRIKTWNKDSEMVYTWKKSEKGDDHFFHTLAYTIVASYLVGVAKSPIILPFMVKKVEMSEGLNLQRDRNK